MTKLEGGKGGGNYKFFCPHGFHGRKPFSGSYTHVRRHLRGVMDSDDKKGAVGIQIFPNISIEQRRKYIQIEEVAQQKNKKQKLTLNQVQSLDLVAHLLMVLLEVLEVKEQ